MKKPSFIILPHPKEDDSRSGHETTVHRRGDAVEKVPRFTLDKKQWMEKQENVRDISIELNKINNPAYRVPRTFVSHGKVYEDFVPGKTLDKLGYKNLDFLIPAIGNLINDMSQMRPIIHSDENRVHSVWFIDGMDGINSLMHDTDKTSRRIPDSYQDLIRAAYSYVAALPENQMLVFAHNDLGDANIIIDENKNVYFIDFAGAGYRSILSVRRSLNSYNASYTGGVASVWNYINKLPRTKNPEINWDINPDVLELQEILLVVCYRLKRYRDGFGKSWFEYAGADCDKLRNALARAAVSKIIQVPQRER